MLHELTINIDPKEWKDAQRILRRKTPEPGYPTLGTIYTFIGRFDNDIEADVKVCNGDGPFIDVVLFEDGCEIACGDVLDDLRSVEGMLFKLASESYRITCRLQPRVGTPRERR